MAAEGGGGEVVRAAPTVPIREALRLQQGCRQAMAGLAQMKDLRRLTLQMRSGKPPTGLPKKTWQTTAQGHPAG